MDYPGGFKKSDWRYAFRQNNKRKDEYNSAPKANHDMKK
jgi:hypothetical protein